MTVLDQLQADLHAAGVRHFKASELLRVRWPEIAARVGVLTPYFSPTPSQRAELVVVASLADKLRERFGGPITVLNGLRPKAYNAEVGGAKGSQHLYGRALDLTAKDIARLRGVALDLYREGLIGGLGLYRGNIHIDTRPGQRIWGSQAPKD